MSFINVNNWDDIVNRTIVIGGSARSGTTLMGKLIHSMNNVEYFFEPPMLLPILNNLASIGTSETKELLSFYLYDQLLLDAIGGRNINLNSNDDSCIYNVKNESDINYRLSKSFRRVELEEIAKSRKIAFKIPASVFFDKELDTLLLNNTKIYMHRSLNDTLNSLVGKGWFSDENLSKDSLGQVYATRMINNLKIPFWVLEEDEFFWLKADEVNRTAYYYYRIAINIEYSKHANVINYDYFVKSPLLYMKKLASELKLCITEKTDELISEVKRTENRRSELAEQVDIELFSKINEISERINNRLFKP
jgi:hypothetical protein